MAVTITPLGFKKPDGQELVKGGDNAIADNAELAQTLIATDRAAANSLVGRVTTAEGSIATHGSRLSTVEAGNVTRDSRLTGVETTSATHGTRLGTVEGRVTTAQADLDIAETQITTTQAAVTGHDTRLGTFESQILGLSAQVNAVSTPFNIGIDLDGVPFYSDGASGLALEADTDGVPYFL